MTFEPTDIPGVYIVQFFHANDTRGLFVKPLHRSTFEKYGLNGDFPESFYSVNRKGVIRGMHFQLPPDDHEKLVYCPAGRLIDVVLDIRQNSPAFGKHIRIELTETNHLGVYMPKGVAHGFESLEDNTVMTYLTSTEHAPASDAGIRYNSFGCEWQSDRPVISERDLGFPAFDEFKTPFKL